VDIFCIYILDIYKEGIYHLLVIICIPVYVIHETSGFHSLFFDKFYMFRAEDFSFSHNDIQPVTAPFQCT
jgi:hypothetical protein